MNAATSSHPAPQYHGDNKLVLGIVLAVVTFGHLLHEPLYEFHTHVIPRLALLLLVLLLPRADDRFSLDYVLARRVLKV